METTDKAIAEILQKLKLSVVLSEVAVLNWFKSNKTLLSVSIVKYSTFSKGSNKLMVTVANK
jgi:hypothetical protein